MGGASLAGCLPLPGPLGPSRGRPAAFRIDGVPRPAHAVGLCDPWRRSGRTRREEATRKVVCGRTRAGLGAKDPKQFDPKQLEPEWQRRRARGRAGEAQKNLQEKRDIPPTHPRYTPDTYMPDAPPMHPRRARGLIVRAAGAAAIGMAIAQLAWPLRNRHGHCQKKRVWLSLSPKKKGMAIALSKIH